MPTATLALPNGELVCQAWLARYADIPAGFIAGTLPKDPKEPRSDADYARMWTRFLTVRALPAGAVHQELTERRGSILQLDAWARELRGSGKQPRGVSANMLERVRVATFRDAQPYGKPLDMPVSGYLTARVLAAYLVSEPRRVEGDPSGFARMTCDLAVDWTV
jgi:hypothetical protein